MILKFFGTVFKNFGVCGVYEGELIRMHRYPHVLAFNKIPSFLEFFMETCLPVKVADWMGGERNQIRGYSEK
jgi:hypothetical protein